MSNEIFESELNKIKKQLNNSTTSEEMPTELILKVSIELDKIIMKHFSMNECLKK